MRVILIRHADPDYKNDSITEKGYKQAKLLAEFFPYEKIDHLFVSPFGRAKETVKPLENRFEISSVELEWIRELNGNWEGNRWAWNYSGVETLHPGKIPEFSRWVECVPYGKLLFPQWKKLGENFDELLKKLGYKKENLIYKVEKSSEINIVFVCHAGTILTLISYLTHISLPLTFIHFSCEPSSITEIIWEENQGFAVPRIIKLNDTSHLSR